MIVVRQFGATESAHDGFHDDRREDLAEGQGAAAGNGAVRAGRESESRHPALARGVQELKLRAGEQSQP